MEPGTVADWVSAIGTWFGAVASLAVVVFAVFHDWIREQLFKPECLIEWQKSGPYWQRIDQENNLPSPSYRKIRFLVTNIGNAPGRDVEVHVLAVANVTPEAETRTTAFVPVRLKWTYGRSTKGCLAPACAAYVDFAELTTVYANSMCVEDEGFSVRKEEIPELSLCVNVPNADSYYYHSGVYRFEIGVVGSVGYLRRSIFEVRIPRTWDEINEAGPLEHEKFSVRHVSDIPCRTAVRPPWRVTQT